VHNAVTLEEVARIAFLTTALRPDVRPLSEVLREKHYSRKHGPGAYYGQP
jgi:L-ribulose-5-phosphate 4-epimerase